MSPPPTRLRERLALFLATSLLVAAVAALVWKLRTHPADTTVVIDNRAQIDELLAARAVPTGAPPSTSTDGADTDLPLLAREPLSLAQARTFFPQCGLARPFNQLFYYARPPHRTLRHEWPEHPDGGYEIRTNSLGMREDQEVLPSRPHFRVLVTGDSHTDGVCSNAESFPNRLEARLEDLRADWSIEVLNAGVGGYNLYNYAGVLEHYAYLEPHLFVMAVYGGNDFWAAVALQRFFLRRHPPQRRNPTIQNLLGPAVSPGGIAHQELSQVAAFAANPEDVARAVETSNQFNVRLQRLAAAIGSRLLFVYIPPPFRGQPTRYAREIEDACAKTGVTPEEIAVTDRVADAWIAHARGLGIDVLDLRPVFRSCEDPLYWRADSHINLRAHERIAEELEPMVVELFRPR